MHKTFQVNSCNLLNMNIYNIYSIVDYFHHVIEQVITISADWRHRWCHYGPMLSLQISFKFKQLVCFETFVILVRCSFAPFAAAHGISFSCYGSLTKAPWCSGICELKSSRASRQSSRKWTRRNQVSPTRSNTWTARGNLCSGWVSGFTLCQNSVKTVFLLKFQWIVRCVSWV